MLWPFAPVSPYTESLEWASDVLDSWAGSQRIRLREAPNQRFSLGHTFSFAQYERARLMVQATGAGPWQLPIWCERQRVSVASGAGSITVDTTTSDYRDGGLAVLWASDTDCEVVTVASVAAGSLTLTGTVAGDYADAFVMPARVAYTTSGLEAQRSVQPRVAASIEFVAYEGVDLSASSYTLYRGYPAVTDCPRIGAGGFTDQLLWPVELVEGLGTPFHDPASGRVTRSATLAWKPYTRAALWDLRCFLHSLYGRQKAFWVPDHTRGLTLASPVSPGDSTLTVQAVGLNATAETGDLYLQTTGGSVARLQYTAVTPSGSTEILTLSGTAGISATPDTVRTLCLMRLCRLAADGVQLEHQYRGRDRDITHVAVACTEVPFA